MKKTTNNKRFSPVSIVMPMRNSSTTVIQSLESLAIQKYPIQQVIVVDNASEDNSVAIVTKYAKKLKLPIDIIKRKKNGGVCSSYNVGAKKAMSSFIVFMHSDCALESDKELENLTEPFRKDPAVLATYATINLRMNVWESYSFWEKSFFARLAGKGYAGPTGKFDCIRKDIFNKLGGFDTKHFGIGGEDMDLAQKICAIGKFVLSDAKATHLHYLGSGYTFISFLKKKKQYAMIYGRLLRQKPKLFLGKSIMLLLKPFLAVLLLIPLTIFIAAGIIILYTFLTNQKMFASKSALSDWKILTIFPVNFFLIYYETFWIIASFFFGENAVS